MQNHMEASAGPAFLSMCAARPPHSSRASIKGWMDVTNQSARAATLSRSTTPPYLG